MSCFRVQNSNQYSSQLQNFSLMAFVTRSQKQSAFDLKLSKQMRSGHAKVHQSVQPNERIHIGADQQFRRLLGQKPKEQRQLSSMGKCQPSISSENLHFTPPMNTSKTNNNYDFKKLRKRQYESKLNESMDSSLQQATQYYSKPGCLSPKTMVKYMKTQNKSPKIKQTKCFSPGPGTYNPKIPKPNSHCPVFKQDNYSQLDYLKQSSDQQNQQDKGPQKLFAVRYKTMNSSVFKKSPNLVNASNRNLVSTLFYDKQDIDDEKSQANDCQYVQVAEVSPGPGYYNQMQKQYSNGILFGNTKRFICQLSDGSNKYYDISQSSNSPKSQAHFFASEVPRFQKQQKIQRPLQYTSFQNSFINLSKNRKHNGFSPKFDKPSSQKIDCRPYYNVKKIQKKQFMAKFSQYQEQRNIFNIKLNDEHGPANYQLCPKWQKEHGCIFGKSSKIKTYETMESQNKENHSSIFFLASQATLENNQVKPKPINKKQSVKLPKSNTKIDRIIENHCNKYYNTSPSWEKKSFNVHFVNDILPANNPIKNKML